MKLTRALIMKRGIFEALSLVKDFWSKRLAKNNLIGELELGKREGFVYEQTNENGVIRIRMTVKKCDLEKLFNTAGVGYDDVLVPSLVEQILRQVQRKHHAKVVYKRGSSSWTPALRSIPDDF